MRGLIGKTGQEALKRRIFERDLEKIDINDAEDAHDLIFEFNKEDIEIISKAAAVFFSWVNVVTSFDFAGEFFAVKAQNDNR